MQEQDNGITRMGATCIHARSIVETIWDPLIVLDADLRVICANRAFYRTFGIAPEQTMMLPVFAVGNGLLDIPELRGVLEEIASRNAVIEDLEIARDFPGLGHRIMLVNGRRVGDGGGKENLILLGLKDCTEQILAQRKLETSEARYQNLVEGLNSIIISVDARGVITFINRFAERVFGYSRDEVVGRRLVGTLLPEKDSEGRDNAGLIAGIIRNPESFRNESIGRKKNGEEIWFAWSARINRDNAGAATEILIDGRDLTIERRERGVIREANALIEESPDLMIRLDPLKRYLFVNREFLRITGKNPGEILGKQVGTIGMPAETTTAINDALDVVIGGQREETMEFSYGDRIYLATIKPAVDETGGLKALMIFGRDITRRREVEERLNRERERLRESEERFRAVLENSRDAAYRRDLDTDRYDYISPVVAGITGFPADEFGSLDTPALIGRIHPDDLPVVVGQIEGEIATDRTWGRMEYRFRREDGDYVWIADNFRVLRNENGWPRYRIGMISDITPHKQMEENLSAAREIAEKRAGEAEAGKRIIEAVFDNVPDGFTIVDGETQRVQMVSQYLADFAGRRREDFRNITLAEYAKYLDIKEISGEPIPFANMPIFRSLVHGELVLNMDYLLTNIKGETITVQVNTAPVRDSEGRIVKVIVVWRNIEHLKRIETELRASRDAARGAAREARERQRILEAILVSIPEGITIVSAPEGRLQLVSRYYVDFIGIPEEKLMAMSMEERLQSIETRRGSGAEALVEDYPVCRALTKGEVVFDEEWSIGKADGTKAIISVIAAPVRDERREITHAVVSFRDVTESKHMETALRRNEYELRTLVESSPDLILRIDRELRYLFVNTAYEHLTGVSRERFIGKTNQEMGMPEEQSGPWEKGLKKVFQTGREMNIEFSFRGLFGKRYFWGRIIPEFDRNGAMETVMMVARDITERKQAEERIRYISFHDNVTGLYNRAYFEEEVRRLDSGRLLPVSIIMGDINNLKLVNDTFGHQEGDALLRVIADILKEICRDEDIVARWGGDEFAVILPETDPQTADEVISRIREAASRSRGGIIRPSIALGTAAKTNADENIHEVIRRAEAHMYDNKVADLRLNQETLIASLLERVREKWRGLPHHLERTRGMARIFGGELGLSDSQMEDMLLLIDFHDIGKVVVPDTLLLKEGRLTIDEWETVKRYPETGYRIVKTFPDTAKISDTVLALRENWDGTGYPRGLKNKEIPYLSRIFAILDVYDVITHERPYARAFSREEAIDEIRGEAGRQFDPELADMFTRIVAA